MQDGHEYCEPGKPFCSGCKAAAYDALQAREAERRERAAAATVMSEQLWKDRALAAEKRAEDLLVDSRRFYAADGTSEVLSSPEEVIERRIAAARELRDEKGTREGIEAQMRDVADALRDAFKSEDIANLTVLGVAMKARDRLAELAFLEETLVAATPRDAGSLEDRVRLVFGKLIEQDLALQRAACMWCGFEQENRSIEAARAHLAVCEEHPMAELRRELERERAAVAEGKVLLQDARAAVAQAQATADAVRAHLAAARTELEQVALALSGKEPTTPCRYALDIRRLKNLEAAVLRQAERAAFPPVQVLDPDSSQTLLGEENTRLRAQVATLTEQNEHLEDQNAQLRLLKGCCGKGDCEPEAAPEPLPCIVYPDEHMAACPQALRGGPAEGETAACAEAPRCHETLKQKAPAVLQLLLEVARPGP